MSNVSNLKFKGKNYQLSNVNLQPRNIVIQHYKIWQPFWRVDESVIGTKEINALLN